MRVVGGIYKGRALYSPRTDSVRPTTDKVKESVFNILRSKLPDAAFLDLFAGSGGMGIEAISLGATAVFVDASRESCRLVEKNLAHVGASAEVVCADFATALRKFSAAGRTFDVIYVDPPYASDCDAQALDRIGRTGVLNRNGVIVVEHTGKQDLLRADSPFEEKDRRRYGTVWISFFGIREEL